MIQRLVAASVAGVLVLALLVLAAFVPLPYATYSPGPTINVLAKDQNEAEIIQVLGHKTYRDDGQLRMTTVVSSPDGKNLGLLQLLGDWVASDDAVYPYDFVHPEDVTPEEEEQQGQISMITSQDTAAAVALRALDYKVRSALEVAAVEEGSPADGVLRVRDIFVSVDGEKVTEADDLTSAVQDAGAGTPLRLVVLRDGDRKEITIEPAESDDGPPRIGVSLGVGYRMPFDVTVNIDPAIGGPSAGLMFSLAIYDTLTPGSLTGGHVVAGTGEIAGDGTVGPIGGIQQKVAGSERDGAELFLVPADNCADVAGVDTDMTLVKATTMKDALDSVQTWVDDPDADLPSCA